MSIAIRNLRGPATAQRRLAIVDLIAFVVLALGIGLAAGLALIGTVLLFSGEAAAVQPATAPGALPWPAYVRRVP